MSKSSSLESVIDLASNIKKTLVTLCELFTRMAPIIEKEHQAISSGKLGAVEAVTAEKVALGDAIELNHQELRLQVDRLSMWAQMTYGTNKIGVMSDCVSILQQILSESSETGLPKQVLTHLAQSIQQQLDTFRIAADKAQPLIETNRIVIEKAMYNHQESFRFWQEVLTEHNATYDQKGQQRPSHSGSLLQIKT